MVSMKSTLIVTLLTVLRLGIPLLTLLIIGEAARRHDQSTHKPRGA
jgi:hypothetical protein